MNSLVLIITIFLASAIVQTAPTSTPTSCSLPDTTGKFQTVDASLVNVDQDIANAAIAAASYNGAVSIKVFRYNCILASSQALYPYVQTSEIPSNLFSATKGVISILTGIAHDKGLLGLDDPIDKYLPVSILNSWGDTAHRAITIRQLLTETAGTAAGVLSEAITILLDDSLPQEALAQKLVHPPGTVFTYAQRTPDLLAYVVSRAVNQELQAFAQEHLFGPIGIPENRYTWFRDRSYNTYGYAWLYLMADDFARLGLLMQNGGIYNGVRVLSESYVNQVSVPSPKNGCYGLLFWTNQNQTSCISPTGYLFHRSWIPSAPSDLYAMAGAPQQKNYIIPSLNMTVSFLSVLPNSGPSGGDDEAFYEFFKALMPGILDPNFIIPGPGYYDTEPAALGPVLTAADLGVLLADIDSSPTCNILFCNGGIPVEGLLSNLLAIQKLILQDLEPALKKLYTVLMGA